MNSFSKDESAAKDADTNESKWGYAFAGAIALGFAGVIQFAFGGLDEETLEIMPAIVKVPYEIAGKLGITVALAVIGLSLIARDVIVNRVSRSEVASGRRSNTLRIAKQTAGAVDDADLPIAEDVEPARGKKPGAAMIAALTGRFEGRGASGPATTGGPTGDSNPAPPSDTGGQMVLSSAKYLNRNVGGDPGGTFRKGNTQHTSDE